MQVYRESDLTFTMILSLDAKLMLDRGVAEAMKSKLRLRVT